MTTWIETQIAIQESIMNIHKDENNIKISMKSLLELIVSKYQHKNKIAELEKIIMKLEGKQ